MPRSAGFCLTKAEECDRRAQEAQDKDVRRVLLTMRDFWINAADRSMAVKPSEQEPAPDAARRAAPA